MSITLNCKGTGIGPITYHWENSNINGGQWMRIIDTRNTTVLVVKNLDQSELYRCVASNDVGITESNIAKITFLSKCDIQNPTFLLLYICL